MLLESTTALLPATSLIFTGPQITALQEANEAPLYNVHLFERTEESGVTSGVALVGEWHFKRNKKIEEDLGQAFPFHGVEIANLNHHWSNHLFFSTVRTMIVMLRGGKKLLQRLRSAEEHEAELKSIFEKESDPRKQVELILRTSCPDQEPVQEDIDYYSRAFHLDMGAKRLYWLEQGHQPNYQEIISYLLMTAGLFAMPLALFSRLVLSSRQMDPLVFELSLGLILSQIVPERWETVRWCLFPILEGLLFERNRTMARNINQDVSEISTFAESAVLYVKMGLRHIPGSTRILKEHYGFTEVALPPSS